MLIFLHIPKAAGTTLNLILKNQFRQPGAICQFHHWDPAQVAAHFKTLSPDKQRAVQIMTGHMHFGAHQFLTTPVSYFTLLRDPIDRIVSYYYYLVGNPHDPAHDIVTSRKLSLLDFATSGLIPQVDNGQTRLLAGALGLYEQIPFGCCREDLLQTAEANLSAHVAVAGLQEDFDATLLLLQRTYGWKMPYYVQQNVTKTRPLVEAIPPEVHAAIREFNKLDLQLYAGVKQRFEETVTALEPSFSATRKRFEAVNKLYRPMHSVVTARHVLAGSPVGKKLRGR